MQTTLNRPLAAITDETAIRTFPLYALLGVLAVALIVRALQLATGAVSFHSDEAVIALMARHIIEGERPTFFYGQAYMGSLDAWLVAIGFRLFGESVLTIRVVQSALYLCVVASGFAAAWRLSERVTIATVAGLVLAIPPVLLATYTAATLGGYNESLLFGNLLLLLGYDSTHEHRRSWWRWFLLGFIAGVGWWTNGLIAIYALPVALLILRRFSRELIPFYVLALGGFIIGSAPWWVFDFQNDHAALSFYVQVGSNSRFAGNAVPLLPFDQRILGLIFLGLPTLIGLRYPWSPEFFAPLVGGIVVFVYGVAFFHFIRGKNLLKPDARGLLLGMIGLFCIVFVGSKFSIDSTGRYFLPLVLPFGIVLGTLVERVRLPTLMQRRALQAAILLIVLGYHAAGIATVAREYQTALESGDYQAQQNAPGFTTQFNVVSHVPNQYDDDLMTWLEEHDIYHGYTNYWVAFRLAFLSDEQMIFRSVLSYQHTLTYTPTDERYPAYIEIVENADNLAYITVNVPQVEEQLEAFFAANDVTYTVDHVGPYVIYHQFEPEIPRPPVPLPPGFRPD